MNNQQYVIRPSYEVEQRVLNVDNIGRLTKAVKQRKIRMGVVKSIHEQLIDGKHFETAICVNRRSDGDRLFDGGHRVMAMEKFLFENPEAQIMVDLHVYHNLSDEQERSEYKVVNKGTKQNANDVVKQYEDTIPILRRMMNNGFAVEVSVYPSPKSVCFYHLVTCYLGAKQTPWTGSLIVSPERFVELAKQLTVDDYNEMNAFMLDLIEATGPAERNPWFKQTRMAAFFKLWFDNKEKMPRASFIKGINSLTKNYQAVDQSRGGGSGAQINAHQYFRNFMNATRKRYRFV